MQKADNEEQFRGGLVSKAHRSLYHSSLSSRGTEKKRQESIFRRARVGGSLQDGMNGVPHSVSSSSMLSLQVLEGP